MLTTCFLFDERVFEVVQLLNAGHIPSGPTFKACSYLIHSKSSVCEVTYGNRIVVSAISINNGSADHTDARLIL